MIRIEAFTPLAIPLYAALARAARRCGAVRTGPDAPGRAAVLALVGLGVHAWWFARRSSATTPGRPTARDRITGDEREPLRGPARREDGRRTRSASTDVDILVLEEITPALLAQMDAAGLADLLPDRVGRARLHGRGPMILADQPLTDHVGCAPPSRVGGASTAGSRSSACTPVAPVDPAGWRADHAAILEQAEADHADSRRRRHERHRRPRRDARARRRRVRDAGELSQRGLAADLAGQPRRGLPSAAAGGAGSTTCCSETRWPRSAPRPSTSTAATTTA
jgi:hypothetical protein